MSIHSIMGVNEAAELWGLKPGYIKNLCASGKVLSVKIDNRWIIDKNQPSPTKTTDKTAE